MTYIESHSELAGHPKMRRLCRTLDLDLPTAIGHITLLWWWVMDYAPDGDISRFDAQDIADAAQWAGDAGWFVETLIGCGPGQSAGFLDRDEDGRLTVHDWKQYGGKLYERRVKNADNMAKTRGKQGGRHVSDAGDNTCATRVQHVSTDPQNTCTTRVYLEERRGEENREEDITPASASRPRDLHFEALAKLCDVDIENSWQRGALNKAVKEIKTLGGSPDDITTAVRNWPLLWPNARMTAPAIAKHWRELLEYSPSGNNSIYKPFDPAEYE